MSKNLARELRYDELQSLPTNNPCLHRDLFVYGWCLSLSYGHCHLVLIRVMYLLEVYQSVFASF